VSVNSFNDPLLFITGPPVFHLPPGERIEVTFEVPLEEPLEVPLEVLDESTSIYEMRKYMSAKTIALVEKMKFLAKPFQRKAYRPLVFHLEDGVLLQGEVEKVDDEHVTFFLGAGELITYRVDQVKKIVWRGSIMK